MSILLNHNFSWRNMIYPFQIDLKYSSVIVVDAKMIRISELTSFFADFT